MGLRLRVPDPAAAVSVTGVRKPTRRLQRVGGSIRVLAGRRASWRDRAWLYGEEPPRGRSVCAGSVPASQSAWPANSLASGWRATRRCGPSRSRWRSDGQESHGEPW